MPKKAERGAVATPQLNNTKSNKITQEKKVLAHMENYGSITSMTAFRCYGITRLAAVVFRLRKQGYPVDMVTETSASGERYGRYYLRELEGIA